MGDPGLGGVDPVDVDVVRHRHRAVGRGLPRLQDLCPGIVLLHIGVEEHVLSVLSHQVVVVLEVVVVVVLVLVVVVEVVVVVLLMYGAYRGAFTVKE